MRWKSIEASSYRNHMEYAVPGEALAMAQNTAFNYPIWDKAVGQVPWNFFDPMVGDFPIIGKTTAIGGIGCCFMQRFIAFLKAAGYSFPIAEPQKEGNPLFSARYGNVNSARQLLQLFKRAYGEMNVPTSASVWKQKTTGLLIDAFRPAFADPLPTLKEVEEDRERHLACVRRVFEQTEVLLYSIGVTECWLSRSTGIVYPVAPGVLNRDFDAGDIEYHNFTVSETVADLSEFIERLRQINPGVKIITILSPLAMIATYEKNTHVLLANCRSKAVLRAALDEVCLAFRDVHYFPALEIFSVPQSAGRLYEHNRRLVTDAGVDFAMRIFLKHFTTGENSGAAPEYVSQANYADVLCDPELFSAGLTPHE